MADPRFEVPLDELERTARVADPERVEVQAEPWQLQSLVWSPAHPYGDGAGTDADGD